jgi:hypothetical protein
MPSVFLVHKLSLFGLALVFGMFYRHYKMKLFHNFSAFLNSNYQPGGIIGTYHIPRVAIVLALVVIIIIIIIIIIITLYYGLRL